VTTADGEQELAAARVVIATGSKSLVLPGMEPDGRAVIDSDGALSLVELPKRLAIIGAGVIGLEFATFFRRLGSEVTVFEMEQQVLPGVDPELAVPVERLMKREGVAFRLDVRVTGIDRDEDTVVRYEADGDAAFLVVDKVLMACGRVPRTDGLDLDRAGVKTDRQGLVKTGAGFRTSAANVYAIGDVRPGAMLAHRASAEGIGLAGLLTGGKGWKYRALPSCVYTDPEVATVGLSEQQAREQALDVKVSRVPLNAVGRSLTLNRSEGLCKLVVDARTDKVLGAGIVAPQADVLIAEAAVAVELGLTADKLGRVVHPHPTMSELLFEAAEAIHGRAIHIVNR